VEGPDNSENMLIARLIKKGLLQRKETKNKYNNVRVIELNCFYREDFSGSLFYNLQGMVSVSTTQKLVLRPAIKKIPIEFYLK
jgi:hypothetical protein